MSTRLILFYLLLHLLKCKAVQQNYYDVTHPCVDACIQWTSEQKSDSSAFHIYCVTLIPCLKLCTTKLDMLAPIASEHASFYDPICEKLEKLSYLEKCLKILDVSQCSQVCRTTEAEFSVNLDWRNETNFDARLCALTCLSPSYERHCGHGTTRKIFNFYEVVFEIQKKRFNLSNDYYEKFLEFKDNLPAELNEPLIAGEAKTASLHFPFLLSIIFLLLISPA